MKLISLRHPVILTSLAIGFLLSLHSATLGQSDPVNKPKKFPLEVTQQLDSPLIITPTIVEILQPGVLTYRFTIKNLGNKKVEGFAISRSSEAEDLRELTTFISPLAAGDDVDGWTNAIKADMNSKSKILLAVDYIVFADGTSWGKDSRKESELISGFPEGQRIALSKLKKLVERSDEASLAKLLMEEPINVDLSSVNKNNPDHWRVGFSIGYQNTILELRSIYQKQGLSSLPLEREKLNALIKPMRIAM